MTTQNMKLRTVDGWVASEVGKNLIKDLFPPNYTAPVIKKLSLVVKTACYVMINDEKVYVDPILGLNYDTDFTPIGKLEFLEAGIMYHMAFGV